MKLLPPPDWMDEGACAEIDIGLHFPEKGESALPAKRICAMCGVRTECLGYALTNRIRHGVWGGLSERERRLLLDEAA